MAIKCVVFDMAGTTVDDTGNIVGYSMAQAFREVDFIFSPTQVAKYMGMSKPNTIRNLLEEKVDVVYRAFVENMKAYYAEYAEEITGATKVFAALRERGIKVALNTGFPREIVTVILEKLKWDGWKVDAVVCSDEVVRGRPYPDMILRIRSDLGLNMSRTPSTEIMKVGDTEVDIYEGGRAGCGMVVGTSYGSAGAAKLIEAGADHIISSLEEVLDLV